ncbi:MAG: Rv3235 family protein [Kineosporiaceae bacterium]
MPDAQPSTSLTSLASPATEPDLHAAPVLRAAPGAGPTHPARPGIAPVWGALALVDDEDDDEELTPVGALPEPRAWIETFVRVACEVGAGHRPPSQLQRWTTPEVLATLVRRHALATRMRVPRSAAALVRAVHVCEVDERVREASSVVLDRGRMRAVALRLEAAGGRWRVTALEIG